MAADDPTILSYNDSLLRQSDVKLLSKGCWLNDNIIGFVFEYFAIETFVDSMDKILFIPPNITQFIKLGEGSEVGIFVEPLDLATKDMVIQAVNDNDSFDAPGGSHWSVLIYYRPSNVFHHYDSMSGGNKESAKIVAKKIQRYLTEGDIPMFLEPPCPQQTNGSDCGVYALCFVEEACRIFIAKRDVKDTKLAITPQSIAKRREDLIQIIETLSNREKV